MSKLYHAVSSQQMLQSKNDVVGCEINPVPYGCINCPLPACIYDTGLYERHIEGIAQRDTRIWELRKEGVPVPELARAFGIATRTVHRIIQRGGPSERSTQLELDDVQGKPTSQIGTPFHAPRSLPVMRENLRGRAV